MGHDRRDLQDLMDEVTALRARVDAQEAELATLRPQPAPSSDGRIGRRHLLGALAGLGAAGATGIATARPAAAADGDPIILGQANTATETTTVDMGEATTGLDLSSSGFATLTVGVTGTPATYGIVGLGETTGVWGESQEGFGLLGRTTSGGSPAVVAENLSGGPALGGLSTGGGPQLWLDSVDDHPPGPPDSGSRGRGQIKADVNGDVWLCVAGGEPGTWTRLLREDTAAGRLVSITPVRALDTRLPGGRHPGSPSIPGQTAGPLQGGQTVTLDLAGIEPIPATATAVLGNLTVTEASSGGYVQVAPAGSSTNSSALNFVRDVTVANAFTCGISTDGLTLVAPIPPETTYHLIVDITAYIT